MIAEEITIKSIIDNAGIFDTNIVYADDDIAILADNV